MTKFSFKKKQVVNSKLAASSRPKNLVKIVCPVSYVKVYKPDEFMGTTAWKMNVHPDKAAKDKIKAAGGKVTWKDKDVAGMEDPGMYFQVKRPAVKETSKGTLYFSGPNIYDADGNPIFTYDKEISWESADDIVSKGEEVPIGNGSLCEVTLDCYEAGQYGKFFRLESIKILELIEYVEGEEGADELDDEIPFDEEDKPIQKSKTKVEW